MLFFHVTVTLLEMLIPVVTSWKVHPKMLVSPSGAHPVVWPTKVQEYALVVPAPPVNAVVMSVSK